MSTLKITTVDVTKPENRPLLLVTEEIRAFSCGTRTVAYKKYPIAATILFRSLVEQCFKYLLRETYPKLYASLQARSNGDPTLRILVDTINQQKNSIFPAKSTTKRFYTALCDGRNKDSFQDFFNLAAHHSRYDLHALNTNAANFLPIAEFILNTPLTNKETP